MIDPVSVLGAAKVATGSSAELEKASANLVSRLFGPSADVIGEYWSSRLEDRLSNVRRVAELADRRTSGRGAIPARVADSVLRSAQFADSPFVAEYLSGILASSRTEMGRDDSGVSWASLISQLSNDQILIHYVLYAAARPIITETVSSNTDSAMCQVKVLVSFADLSAAIDWDPAVDVARFREAVYGLQRQGLVGTISHGTAPFLKKTLPEAEVPESGGLIYRARIPGLMLYLWGMGYGREPATRLLDPSLDLAPLGFDLPGIPDAKHMGVISSQTQ